MLSAPDAIAQALELYLAEKEGGQEELPIGATAGVPAEAGAATATAPAPRSDRYVDETAAALGACPACGASHLAFEEGCKKCYVCGFSECG